MQKYPLFSQHWTEFLIKYISGEYRNRTHLHTLNSSILFTGFNCCTGRQKLICHMAYELAEWKFTLNCFAIESNVHPH